MSTDPMAGIHNQAGLLGVALAQWEDRERTACKTAARRAGSAAVDAVDELLRQLYTLRRRLVREIHAAADATAAHVDHLLARRLDGGAS